MIFGFNEAAALAAWGALNLFTIPSKKVQPFWITCLHLLLGCLLTGSIFYFTQNAAPDSWQLIFGVVSFMVHTMARKMGDLSDYIKWPILVITSACYFVCMSVNPFGDLWYVALIFFGVYFALAASIYVSMTFVLGK